MVDYAPPSYQFPAGRVSGPTAMKVRQTAPRTSIYGSPVWTTNNRIRTSASVNFPLAPAATYEEAYFAVGSRTSGQNPYYQGAYPGQFPKRRTGSISTTTTSTTSQGRRSSTASSMNIRRSDSTGTASSSTMAPATSAYVANLRRQKATVWCDRSQPEDPRLLAAQQLAKQKAAMEVMGSSAAIKVGSHGIGSPHTSTSSIRNRLGKSSQPIYGLGTGSMVGDLPPRLLATEATGDSDEEDNSYMGTHRRSGSGRSSLNSNHRVTNRASTFTNDNRNSSYGALHRDNSRGSSSRSYSPIHPMAELGEPVLPRGKSRSPQLVSPHILEERSPDVRKASGYFDPKLNPTPVRHNSELRRRGSVDEGAARTMTMTGLRLVVANPD